jgi:Protein of unknown function (DUF3383)
VTETSDVVNVVVNVADTKVTRTGFGVPLILDIIESTVFAARTKSYASITEVAADFATTTKTYKAAAAIFAQSRAPSSIKVGREEAGDANITAALNAIEAEDTNWYCLLTPKRVSADIQEIALWISTRTKIYIANSQDADVLTVVTTDIASILQAASYNRVAYLWHNKSGVDVTGAVYNIASGVITVTQALHGLEVGDPMTFSASSGVSIDGNNTVDTVVDANNYTAKTTAGDDATAPTVNYFANYTFPECAWAGLMLPSDPGSETWKFKQLTGISPADKTDILPSEEAVALGKNANLYTPLAGVGHTQEGVMAFGRFIDIQRGIDWLETTMSETIAARLLAEPKIKYTDSGVAVIEAEINQVLDLGLRNNVLGPLLDNSGDFYRITVPKVADQLSADRTARYFPGIVVTAQLAGAVHSLAITVNANV